MRVPHPDDLLVAAVDRLLVPPQRSGAKLPPLPRAIQVSNLALQGVAVANFLLHGEPHLALIWCVSAYLLAPMLWASQSAYGRDARNWDQALSDHYRDTAEFERRSMSGTRLLLLCVTVAFIAVSVHLALSDLALSLGESWPIILTLALVSLHSYARCAMPRRRGLKR